MNFPSSGSKDLLVILFLIKKTCSEYMYLHQRWGFACVCVVGEGGQQQLPEAFIMHAGVICMSFVDLRGCYNVHLSC